MNEDLTIAIVARDAEKDIVDLFQSIERQTVKPKEVIVVVDYLEDSTIPAAEEFGATVIVNPKGKIYEGRNTAMRLCKTKYLAFTDSDCVLDKNFVKNVLNVFAEHPEIAGGTGRHPSLNKNKNFWQWLHHMRFVVETQKTGYTNGVIGANSYFRLSALKDVGGWLGLKAMAAEDVHISNKLLKRGYKLWFDESIKVYHKYKNNFRSIVKQEIKMGQDLMLMLKAERDYGFLWWYSLAIPVMFLAALGSLVLIATPFQLFGIALLDVILLGSLLYLIVYYRSVSMALPRWFARWVVIPFYSYGIVKGLIKKVGDVE